MTRNIGLRTSSLHIHQQRKEERAVSRLRLSSRGWKLSDRYEVSEHKELLFICNDIDGSQLHTCEQLFQRGHVTMQFTGMQTQ